MNRATGKATSESEIKSLITPGNSLSLLRADGGVTYIGKATTMKQLADELFSVVGSQRKVIDTTGLTALYDVDLVYALPGLLTAAGGGFESNTGRGRGTATFVTSAFDIFTALQGQLGLKLESTKAQLDCFIIDSLDKPSEN